MYRQSHCGVGGVRVCGCMCGCLGVGVGVGGVRVVCVYLHKCTQVFPQG